jgi:hypothetical protein
MGDLPLSGIKPVSPVLAGRFFTTEPSGKPLLLFLKAWRDKLSKIKLGIGRRYAKIFSGK